MNIEIIRNEQPRAIPPIEQIGFGNYFSNHMFTMDYSIEEGWHNAKIEPYGDLVLSPATMSLHYGQEIFEGLKAYHTPRGILLFRPIENMKRLNVSCDRLCIPLIDEEFVVSALKKLVDIDRDWVPAYDGTSLYIRPFIFAADAHLGVRAAHTYKFMIIMSPGTAYHSDGLNPVSIYVEDKYVRASKGGVGYTKTGGNYAASMKAQQEASEKGFAQVLWLDGAERRYVEEVGTMNVFFVIGDKAVTPALDGSILAGITRKSVIEILKAHDIAVEERKISIDELLEAHKAGELKESFGTGTAAGISPIGLLQYKGHDMAIGSSAGEITAMVYNELLGIQYGKLEDKYGWTVSV
jgi:branched-chain amino acid aminotransferase